MTTALTTKTITIVITSQRASFSHQALSSTRERGDKRALKIAKRKQVAMLNKFSEAIRGNLTKLQRAKIVSLVTIEVHARDVIEKLVKAGCSDVTAFDWLSQLR